MLMAVVLLGGRRRVLAKLERERLERIRRATTGGAR